MSGLAYLERPPEGTAAGLLVLHHGRGTDEHDLFGLADILDPERHLHVVTPRAPLRLPGAPGHHWYVVPRVGHPDAGTFRASVEELGAFHDGLRERTGIDPDRTVLGGFSQGAVMSYALGLDPGRPAPAGILALSGFVPTVAGWEPDLIGRRTTRVFIAHGTADPVISVDFARRARALLEGAGVALDYGESPVGHTIAAHDLARAVRWLGRVVPLTEP